MKGVNEVFFESFHWYENDEQDMEDKAAGGMEAAVNEIAVDPPKSWMVLEKKTGKTYSESCGYKRARMRLAIVPATCIRHQVIILISTAQNHL